jgi:hypothetical protein
VNTRFETRLHDSQIEPGEDEIQDDIKAFERLDHRVDLGSVDPVRLRSAVRKFCGEGLRGLETSIRDDQAFNLRTLCEKRRRNGSDRARSKDNCPNDVVAPLDPR